MDIRKVSIGIAIFIVFIAITGSLMLSDDGEVDPDEFEFSNLFINPEEIESGENITLSVDVTNTGVETDTKTVQFDLIGISDEATVTITVTLDVEVNPGETETVQIKYPIDQPGNYQVSVEELTGGFLVLELSTSYNSC